MRRRRRSARRQDEKNKIKFSCHRARIAQNSFNGAKISHARRYFAVKPRRRGAFFPTNSSRKSGLSAATRRA